MTGDVLLGSLPIVNVPRKQPQTHRIALVWEDHRMQAQRTYNGLCQRAGAAASVTLQCFDTFHLGFEQGIANPLKNWSPDGVILRMNRLDQMEILRQMLPEIPFVSTLIVPPSAADTCVGTDINEAIALALRHFRAQGLKHVAMFCSAIPYASAPRIAAFRTIVPDGLELEFAWGDSPGGPKVVMEWLESLPKPVGVMAFEIGAGPFLLDCCNQLGLRVPQDVQIIGSDDDDVSLSCEPHLTSVHLPGKRVGDKAMSSMLLHLRKDSPPPPVFIPVGGCLLKIRASTEPVSDSNDRMAQTIKLMQTHMRQDITVERMAEKLGMGLTSFYKEFANSTGLTPAQYMRQLRLDDACRMLRETDATVTQIARDSGFNSLISFVQFFRRQTGQTPTAYREQV